MASIQAVQIEGLPTNDKIIPQGFLTIKYNTKQFPKYDDLQPFLRDPMFLPLKSPQSKQILKKMFEKQGPILHNFGREYVTNLFQAVAHELGYKTPYTTFLFQKNSVTGQVAQTLQEATNKNLRQDMRKKAYKFDNAKYNMSTYIELIRGNIAFEDFVNLVQASLNGVYLIDYGAWFDISTFPKVLYKIMNSIGPIQFKRIQDVYTIFAYWVTGSDQYLNKMKQNVLKLKTVTDQRPQWLQLPVPQQFLTLQDRMKFSIQHAIMIEPITLGSTLMAINCIYSLIDKTAFNLNFAPAYKIVYKTNLPTQQLNEMWQKSAFDIKKTSFYFQNNQRKKYSIEKKIFIENGKITQLPLDSTKKDWEKDYEAIFKQSKKKAQNLEKYKQITQEMKMSQTIKFGQFSKFAVALEQVKQSQFQQIDKLIKEAFQSHMKALQKCQYYQKNVEQYLQKSWNDLKTTIPLIKSIDDFQQFALNPVDFFIKHMVLPLKVFDVQTIFRHFISGLIHFNKYIRVEGKALHSRYLKIGFEMNIEGQEYIPFDSEQVFLKKQDRSVYYMIGDNLTKKGDKIKLRFSEIKTIYTTIKKFLLEKQSKITIKMIHQRILLFLKNIGGDVEQVQQYFKDEKVNLSSKQLQYLAKKLIPKTQNKELQPE